EFLNVISYNSKGKGLLSPNGGSSGKFEVGFEVVGEMVKEEEDLLVSQRMFEEKMEEWRGESGGETFRDDGESD
ncbi:hypothetical protein Tco_1498510, partial [Tanacetum coccineum]